MACCAIGPCDNPTCAVCTVNARFAVEASGQNVKGKPCRMIKGHPGACAASLRAGKTERAELKGS